MLREASGIKKIYLRAGRTDLRKGIYSLQAMVQMETGISPLEEGTMFLFCGKRPDRIKALVFEGTGWLLMTMHLVGGNRFQWPRNSSDTLNLTREQYEHLMDGFTLNGTIKRIPNQHPPE